ncbi:AMP-binding protein [Nocardia sp. SYP-A9097]|uniref:AMP-binding protein n=1 Tax=Nocardia sp. SYP-A9097 TaxID=2663237 RepID=UPI00129B70C8|nr:AMP-binding protein [Nocardia sp. SYP-A9097]MRH92329.1 AMP-binding protein [Nocardia sp. SYP-A9097]
MSTAIETSSDGVDFGPIRRVAAIARTDGDRIALRYLDSTCTYRELLTRAQDLVGYLDAHGVRPGDRVPYLGGNSVAFFVAYLATAWLGAIFVPVNPRLTAAELGYILADCAPRAAVTEPQRREVAAEVAPALDCALVDAADGRLLSPRVRGVPVPDAVPRAAADAAMLAYTSGTTGRPKGVLLSHGNYAWNCANLDAVVPTAATDCTLVVAPLFHTAPFGCFVLRTLLCGGTTVVSRAFDPERMLEDLVAHQVTTVFAVPAMMQSITRSPRFATADLSRLRVAVIAGASASAELIERFLERDVDLRNGYGLTETLFLTCDPAGQTSVSPGSVGMPLPHTEVRVVDIRSGLPLTVPGATGEVCVRGPNVCAGYWRYPHSAAPAVDADGWFHTGDVGYLDGGGRLFLVDRLKDMIIVGGDNVYSAEVEQALAGFPGLIEIAVVGVPDPMAGEGVAAVVVCADEMTPELAELRRFGVRRLAEYKLPTRILGLPALPRNAMGKIDKTQLRAALRPERPQVRESGNSPATAPDPAGVTARPIRADLSGPPPEVARSRVTAAVAAQVADIVGVRVGSVPPEVSLRDIGLGSLGAVELSRRINAEFGTRLPATAVFDAPTLLALARTVWAQVTAVNPTAPNHLDAVAPRIESTTGSPIPAYIESATNDDLFALLDRHLEDRRHPF